MPSTALVVPLLSLVATRRPIASASEVGDPCSNNLPCQPLSKHDHSWDHTEWSANITDSFFCDFQIGPSAGGYCVACEGRQTYFCQADETGLTEAGRVDCEDKCSLKGCPEPCEEGYFCSVFNFQDGPCQRCDAIIVHPEDCGGVHGFPPAGIDNCMQTCPPKTCSKRRHCLSVDGEHTQYFCNFEQYGGDEEQMGTCQPCAGLKSIDECTSLSKSESGLQECYEVCEDVIVTPCSTNDDCLKDRFFCNNNTTICQACPHVDADPNWHVEQCFDTEKMGLDISSQQNCFMACHTECNDIREGYISVEGLVEIGKESNKPMTGTGYASVSGSLVDCQLGGAGECPADAPENFICLVSRGLRTFQDKVLNCEESGGVATILYNNEENNDIVDGTVGDVVETPITAISLTDGLYLLEHGLGLKTTVTLKNTGEKCDRGCSDSIKCPSTYYCDYKLGTHGYCQKCGTDEEKQRVECFLSGLPLKGAQECASICDSQLAAESCKICGHGIDSSELQSAGEGETKCNFCPDGLKPSHFDREIPFIGKNATCYKLNQFYLNYEIAENDPNCQLALNFNYICDCEGPGYAGAHSDAMRQALVWVPRVSAIISFLSSSAIITDVVRDKTKRAKIYGQLMLGMSIFDLMGSAAYSLTTLPMPKEYQIEGSQGNDATCTAQGFFIQMGTISAFINVSLAVYYYCIIRLSMVESRIKKIRRWLFICPITVGLTFAFAGIPFYDMLFLWCNNSAAWWPEIPVVVAIVVVTCMMGAICLYVYKTEKASRRVGYTSDSLRRSFSSTVVWQSFWYLLSFYLTWPPYLALQYLWAAGGGYSAYGFVLFACTLVPLQGFWNMVVFFRVRAKRKANEALSAIHDKAHQVLESGLKFSHVSGSRLKRQSWLRS